MCWAPFQYPIRHLIIRSHEVSKPQKLEAYNIALKFDRYISSSAAEVPVKFQSSQSIFKYNSHSFESSRDLKIRCLFMYWNGTLVDTLIHQSIGVLMVSVRCWHLTSIQVTQGTHVYHIINLITIIWLWPSWVSTLALTKDPNNLWVRPADQQCYIRILYAHGNIKQGIYHIMLRELFLNSYQHVGCVINNIPFVILNSLFWDC